MRLAWILLLVCFLPTSLATASDPILADEPSPARTTVPEGIPVQLDGWTNPSEWRDARALDMGYGVTLYIKQVRSTLLIGFKPGRAWPDRARLLFYLGSGDLAGGVDTPGTLRLDYEPREHDRPHLIARRAERPVSERVIGRIAARHRAPRGVGTVEIAIPDAVLPGDGTTLRLVAQWAVPGQRRGAQWPAGVELSATSRALPPGLAVGTDWGHLEGFKRKGTGAYPPAEWKAWHAADRILEDKGDTAHSYLRLLIEEWRTLSKKGDFIHKEFFEPLQSISAREPLSLDDMHAQARVLHWLNRHDEALGLFEGLAAASPRLRKATANSRARLFESMHRFRDAATMWTQLAKRPGLIPMATLRFTSLTRRALQHAKQWDDEQTRRKAAEAIAGQPLLLMRTPRGTVVVLLHQHTAPKAVAHFLSFVDEGAYDGTSFHRVHGDAKAQGGTLASKQHGCDFSGAQHSATKVRTIAAIPNGAHGFFRGALALVRQSSKIHDSEFLFVTGAHPEWRKDGHTIIGHVISGLDAVLDLDHCDSIETMRVLK